MPTDIIKDKVNVFNSGDLLCPVGLELKHILESNNIDIEYIIKGLGINQRIETIIKLTKRDLKYLNEEIRINSLSDYLSTYQDNYKQKKNKADRVYKEYMSIYKKFEYVIDLKLSKFNAGIDRLNDFADFLGVEDEVDISHVINNKSALYKIAGSRVDNVALFVWKRRGEELFKEMDLPLYNKSALEEWVNNGDWKNNLNNVSYFKRLPSILSEMGVGLVLDSFVKKTVYGYVDWIDNKPLIQISDRGKNLAICWYTLFHEIGHVILHQNHQIFEGDLDFSKSKMTKTEKEANDFAFNYLFNGRSLQGFIFGNKKSIQYITEDTIQSIASRFNVSPMFVSFWFNKAGLGNYIINKYIPHIEFDAHQ